MRRIVRHKAAWVWAAWLAAVGTAAADSAPRGEAKSGPAPQSVATATELPPVHLTAPSAARILWRLGTASPGSNVL